MKKGLVLGIMASSLLVSGAAFAKGYVKLYEDKGFLGRSVSFGVNRSQSDLHAVGFNDQASSVKYSIPSGYVVVLHADTGFAGTTRTLAGSGSIDNLGGFEDKCSSVEWRKQ